jgi:hypothetical protein
MTQLVCLADKLLMDAENVKVTGVAIHVLTVCKGITNIEDLEK